MSEADMNHDAELSRAYAATPRDEPPPAMDEAILARARSAMNSEARGALQDGPGKAGTQKGLHHWSQRFAIAATLVVTASLVVMMQNEQTPIPRLGPPARDAAITPAAKRPTEAVQMAETAPADVAQSPGKVLAKTAADRSSADKPSESSSIEREPPAAAPATPASLRADEVTASVPARQAFPAARQDTVEDAKASAAAPVALAAPPKAELRPQQSSAPVPDVTGIASGPAMVERRSLKSAEGAARIAPNPGAAKEEVSPEAWLVRIAEMRKQGRVKEADESLAEFRKRYPGHPVPAANAQTP